MSLIFGFIFHKVTIIIPVTSQNNEIIYFLFSVFCYFRLLFQSPCKAPMPPVSLCHRRSGYSQAMQLQSLATPVHCHSKYAPTVAFLLLPYNAVSSRFDWKVSKLETELTSSHFCCAAENTSKS